MPVLPRLNCESIGAKNARNTLVPAHRHLRAGAWRISNGEEALEETQETVRSEDSPQVVIRAGFSEGAIPATGWPLVFLPCPLLSDASLPGLELRAEWRYECNQVLAARRL